MEEFCLRASEKVQSYRTDLKSLTIAPEKSSFLKIRPFSSHSIEITGRFATAYIGASLQKVVKEIHDEGIDEYQRSGIRRRMQSDE